MRKRASNAKYKQKKQAEKRQAKDRKIENKSKRDLDGKTDDKVYLKRSGVGEDAVTKEISLQSTLENCMRQRSNAIISSRR